MKVAELRKQIYEFGGAEYEVLYRLNVRSKRVGIRIASKNRIVVNVPSARSMPKAERFFEESRQWVDKQLVKTAQSLFKTDEIAQGMSIVLGGREYLRLDFDESVKDFLINKTDRLLLVNDANKIEGLKSFYKSTAYKIFVSRVDLYTRMLGVSYNKVVIRDQSGRWGSCSGKGNLNFSWRVVMAPPKVIDYLVVHEVCHLKFLNHSADFWGLVKKLMPDYKEHDKWLRVNGHMLRGFLD